MSTLEEVVAHEEMTEEEQVEDMYTIKDDDKCSDSHLVIQNNVNIIKTQNSGGHDNDYNPGF